MVVFLSLLKPPPPSHPPPPLSGESGSGKTENSKRLIQFFAVAAAGGRSNATASNSAGPRRTSFARAATARRSVALGGGEPELDLGDELESQAALFAKRVSLRRASVAEPLLQKAAIAMVGG